MRSFTNKDGDKITVSEEHLQTAVDLKREIQMESPSHRCNWSRLVKSMKNSGFPEAEVSESYRCLIKSYQKSIGELPSKEKFAEIVSDSKIKAIKEAVGELYYTKRSVQLESLRLNKLKRDLTLTSVVAEEISNAIKNVKVEVLDVEKINVKNKDREMLVLPSDWHVGYFSSNYNHEVATSRVKEYADKVIEYANIFNIEIFNVVHMGDIVENIYMHKNTQSYSAEFNFSEQIVKATELLFMFLNRLSSKGKVIYRGTVRGNHGRLSNKGETLDNDCAEYIVHETVKGLVSVTNNPNIEVDESGYDVNSSMFYLKKKSIKVIHGDKDSQNDRSLIQKHISLENKIIDLLCMGHYHNFKTLTENHGRSIYQSGCLQGSTEYGKSLKFDNPPSQGLIVLSADEVLPININLQ